MFEWRVSKKVVMCTTALAACSAVAMLALAAVKPLPPAKVCIGSNCVTATEPAGNIKWHPGHYVWIAGPGWNSKVEAATNSVLTETASDANLAGVQIIFHWAELEGDTAGDYSAGFATVDSLLAKMAALPKPKRLIISVQERSFGTASGVAPGGVYPRYIVNMSGGVAVSPAGVRWAGSLQSIARMDNPALMDRLIALAEAYGKRYDSNSLVEMYVPMGELAYSAQSGLNATTYIQQVKRLYAAAAKAWPSTLLRWQFNYAPADKNDQVMLSMLAYAATMPQSIVGGPDPESPLPLQADYPDGVRTIQSNRVFRGLKSGASEGEKSYEDLRGKLPWVGEYQGVTSFGVGGILPADFGSYQVNVMHASHLIYCRNTWLPAGTASNDPHKWGAQLAYIKSVHGATYAGATPAVVASATP